VLNKQPNTGNEPNFSRLFTNNGKKNGVFDYGKLNPDDIINDANNQAGNGEGDYDPIAQGGGEILQTDTIPQEGKDKRGGTTR